MLGIRGFICEVTDEFELVSRLCLLCSEKNKIKYKNK